MADTPKARLEESLKNTKAEYRQLGKSGLRVSVPIFGAMSFGSPEWERWIVGEEVALPLLKAAYDRGLNTWDTANAYSNGVSETIIGKAIKKYNIPRHKLVILTKCFFYVGEEPGCPVDDANMGKSKDYVNSGGLSRAAIFNAVDASLKRLDCGYIDLLQIHRFDPDVPMEETMEALHDVVKSGKVRYIGASSMWTYQFAMLQHCAALHAWTPFTSMQNQYSLLYREEEREMNAYCAATGVGLIPWSPLCRGILARPPDAAGTTARSAAEVAAADESEPGNSAVDGEIVRRVQEIGEKRGWTMAQVALAWVGKRVTSPIIGFSSVARIDEALACRGKELTAEEERHLEELYVPRAVDGHF